MSIDELKARADELGIEYGPRIGAETLAARIAEAEQARGADDADKPASDPAEAVQKAAESPKGKTLDRDRPYATVHGGDGPARYCQDGVFFDNQGKPCQGI